VDLFPDWMSAVFDGKCVRQFRTCIFTGSDQLPKRCQL
jgi:hypothetical protein